MRKDGTFSKVTATRHSNHPRWSAKKQARPKSPKVAAELHSQEYVGETSSNAVPDVTLGVEAADTARVRRPKLNTNANRKHGGSSTIYRPKAEDLAGRDIVNAGASVTAPHVTRVSTGVRFVKGQSEAQRDAGVAEGLRQAAMERHSQKRRDGVPHADANEAWPAKWNFGGR